MKRNSTARILTGLGGTALIAILFWWASPLREAGAAFWGCVAVLGALWAALAGLSPAPAGDAAVAPQKDVSAEALKDISHIADLCVEEIGRQNEAVRGELDRVQALLTDAIARLTASFQGMQDHAARQQHIALGVIP